MITVETRGVKNTRDYLENLPIHEREVNRLNQTDRLEIFAQNETAYLEFHIINGNVVYETGQGTIDLEEILPNIPAEGQFALRSRVTQHKSQAYQTLP